MFWNKNKIPDGYVETVDGYLIKESEAKIVTSVSDFSSKIEWYRKENAPKYDVCDSSGSILTPIKYYKNNVQVKEDGTPIGFYTKEEYSALQEVANHLKDRIKELEDKYEKHKIDHFVDSVVYSLGCDFANGKDYTVFSKPKNKRGRPKKK